MNILQAIILGIVEGATEFLPVSSTFHLIWASNFLGISQTDFQKMFEVVIQSGAILAVVILFGKSLVSDWQLVKKILLSFLPTALVGLIFYRVIKDYFFENYLLQIAVFIAIGVVFILFEKFKSRGEFTREISDLTLREAVFVGMAQSLSVLPGVSRAGAVILMLMFLRVRRDESAKYSFLLALPTIMAASGYDFLKVRSSVSFSDNDMVLLFVGFVFAFLSALVVIRWFISFLQKSTLIPFGWYRVVLGVILLMT